MDTYLMQVVLWILCFMEVAMCFWLLDIFFGIKKRLNKKRLIGVVACVGLVGALLAINRQIVFFSHNMWLLSMVVTSIFAVIIIRQHLLLLVESIVIWFSSVALLDFFFVYVIESLFGAVFWHRVYFETISWWGMLILVITRIIGLWLLLLAKKMIPKEMDAFVLEKILVPICVVLCVLVRFFQVLLVAIARDGFEFKSWTIGVVIVSCLVLLLFVAVFFQRSIILRTENEILQARDDVQEKRYLDLQYQSEENKHIVHDMKNHILTLQGLCQSKDINAVSEYLLDMNGVFENYDEESWCDNVVINTILNQKVKIAKDMNIICDVQCMPYIKTPLNVREEVIVFGNLLDNAIEANQKVPEDKRNLMIVMHQKQNFFHLEIANSIHIRPEIKNNRIITSKADKKNHGYGLKNVARVVEKYQGVMLLEATEHIFKVSISFFV